jgi:ribonucleoside-diphosphate reductase alpha chain
MMWSGRGVLATIQFRDDSIMAGGEALKTVEFQPVAGGDAALRPQLSVVRSLQLDRSRDDLLTEFGKKTLEDRYLLPGESYQDMFARVATAYADDHDHAQRVYDYMSKLWFMPSTPVLSNGGADRGLPISCFLNAVADSLDGIQSVWNENVALASNGGGIGTYWGGVRSIGEKVKGAGQTSGIIPFIRVMDSLTLAISQGSLRRGSAAVYLDVHHPEIEEFLEIRKPSGDFNRKSLNLHHGINISDAFMEAVRDGRTFDLL